MRKVLALTLMVISISGLASQVEWGCVSVMNMGPGCYDIAVLPEMSSAICVLENEYEGGVKLSAEQWFYSENCNAWLLADLGTVVDEALIKSSVEFFHMHNIYGSGYGSTDYDIIIPDGESVYLAIAYADGASPSDVYFAWAELSVDDSGSLIVLNSAADFGHNAIVVGGEIIPEPSSGLLLLLGIAGLALRRKAREPVRPISLRSTLGHSLCSSARILSAGAVIGVSRRALAPQW